MSSGIMLKALSLEAEANSRASRARRGAALLIVQRSVYMWYYCAEEINPPKGDVSEELE